jgi:hypothetical protein
MQEAAVTIEHAETCRCGASITVKDDEPRRIDTQVRGWRRSHLCIPPGEQSGSGCAVIGFAAQPRYDRRVTQA